MDTYSDRKHHVLEIDPEFERLHIPADENAMKLLEEKISLYGATRTVLVWHGFVIDGHKHYHFYHKHHVPFKTKSYHFNNRSEVIEWICDRNLLRSDLTNEYRKYFVGKKYLARCASRHAGSEGNGPDYDNNSSHWKCEIADQVSVCFNLTRATIFRYARYTAAIDLLFQKEPSIAENILQDKIRISKDNVTEISQMPSEDLKILRNSIDQKCKKQFLLSEIRNELQWNRIHPASASPRRRRQVQKQPEIKLMPKYDPDAEISSLSLTIPSWISSMERVRKSASFSSATEPAKEKLLFQLTALSGTIHQLSSFIKEDDNEHGNGTEP